MITLPGPLQTRCWSTFQPWSGQWTAKCQGWWPCHRRALRTESYSLQIQDGANGTMNQAVMIVYIAQPSKNSSIGSLWQPLYWCLLHDLHGCSFQTLSVTVWDSAINKWNQWQPETNQNVCRVDWLHSTKTMSAARPKAQGSSLWWHGCLRSAQPGDTRPTYLGGSDLMWMNHIWSKLHCIDCIDYRKRLKRTSEKKHDTLHILHTLYIHLTKLLTHVDPGFRWFRFWPQISWSRMRNVEYIGIGARPGK